MATITVQFEPWEYEAGFQVGIRRYTANWNKRDAAHYDRASMEDDRKATVSAALCELAVAKHLNQYWHGSVWHAADHTKHRSMPDVGKDIEVRRVRSAAGVAVRRADRGRTVWAARIEDPEYRTCELLGSISGDRAWEIGEPVKDYVVVPFASLVQPREG